MTILLALAYGVVFCVVALIARIQPKNLLTYAGIFTLGTIISLSRNSFNTGDLPVYLEGFKSEDWSLYYLREAPFWYVGRFLMTITRSPQITFITLDSFVLWLILREFRERPGFPLFIILWAFPTILGYTNIYRQMAASVLMMTSLSLLGRGSIWGLILATLASFVHIALAGFSLCLVATYLALFRRNWLIFLIPASLLISSTLPVDIVLSDLTGGTESRNNTGSHYIFLGGCIHLIGAHLLWTNKHLIAQHTGLIIFFLSGALSLDSAPDSTGTRIMMISIHLTTFLICIELNKNTKPRSKLKNFAIALTVAITLITPTIISPSAWHLIFGYPLE